MGDGANKTLMFCELLLGDHRRPFLFVKFKYNFKNMDNEQNQAENIFSEFTNLYELSKTLRFELKPVLETKDLLEKGEGKNLIQMDQEIDRLYEKEMKPMFDVLHERFINESLNLVKFDFTSLKKLEDILTEAEILRRQVKEARKNKSDVNILGKRLKAIFGDGGSGKSGNGEIADLQAELRNAIIKSFNLIAEKWKNDLNGKEVRLLDKKGKKKINIKKDGPEILREENVLAILAHFNTGKTEIIKKFVGFFTYFGGFNQNRANYYIADAKATSIANRSINKNFIIFLANRKDFAKFKERVPHLVEFNFYFELENYEKFLSQIGIEEYNEQIGKIKQIVNLEHNQLQKENKFQLRGLKTLEKQIGCRTKKQREGNGEQAELKFLEKVGLGFQVIKNDAGEYLIWECMDYVNEELREKLKNVKENYQKFFTNWQSGDYDLENIWFRKEAINTISGRWFGGNNWFIIGKALAMAGVGKFDKSENTYKIPEFISMAEIKIAFEMLEKGIDFDLREKKRNKDAEQYENKNIVKYFPQDLFKEEYQEKLLIRNSLFGTMLAVWQKEIDVKFGQIEKFLSEYKTMCQEKFDRGIKDDNGRSIHTEAVKNLIEEGYLRLFQLSKYHNLDKKDGRDSRSSDSGFYSVLEEFWKDNIIVVYHKALQATLTKKPYSEEKIKLNFENATLASGFDINKESDNTAIILRDEKYFYLAIMGKGNNYSFNKEKNHELYEDIDNKWQKMDYKYLPDVSKMIPKATTQRKDIILHFKKSDESYELFDKKVFNKPLIISKEVFELNNRIYLRSDLSQSVIRDKKGEKDEKKYVKLFQKDYYAKCGGDYNVYLEALWKWIDFCKEYLASYKSCNFFDFSSLNETKNYDSLDNFYFDVDRSCYMKKFIPINYQRLHKLITDKKVYLFKIYNKDFSDKKIKKLSGNDNLETIILKNLFSEKNLSDKNIKLNGEAELFYRKASIKPEADEERSKNMDIIANKRYSEDKYFFHFPITINFGTKKSQYRQFNNEISKKIQKENFNIIGIDRGEKHLLYFSVIDSSGNILDQGSLNEIQAGNNKVDYNKLLAVRAGDMMDARHDWQTIGKIKDLKNGYLSQAVHKIYKLILEHNAVVAMEDLNVEFKAKRASKVEKSVYKNFEMALAKKLNHLILKEKNADECGGV